MKLLNKLIISRFLLVALILFGSTAHADDVLWKSGLNLYIKITDQDNKSIPNQHPVTLDAKEITNALRYMEILDKNLLKEDEQKTVFSIQQASLLGQYLATGLKTAQPDEDITFALVSNESSYLVIKDTYYMAGRAFYANGLLNIIIGTYDKEPDKFRERAEQSHGNTGGIQYFFDNGSRTKKSDFKHIIITKNGIDNHKNGTELRRDWFVINIPEASDAYIAAAEARKRNDPANKNAELIKEEAAKIAKERREMRMEMARMRKEMSENQGANALTVEERLKNLDTLKEKGLVTNDEYNLKRKEILSDI